MRLVCADLLEKDDADFEFSEEEHIEIIDATYPLSNDAIANCFGGVCDFMSKFGLQLRPDSLAEEIAESKALADEMREKIAAQEQEFDQPFNYEEEQEEEQFEFEPDEPTITSPPPPVETPRPAPRFRSVQSSQAQQQQQVQQQHYPVPAPRHSHTTFMPAQLAATYGLAPPPPPQAVMITPPWTPPHYQQCQSIGGHPYSHFNFGGGPGVYTTTAYPQPGHEFYGTSPVSPMFYGYAQPNVFYSSSAPSTYPVY